MNRCLFLVLVANCPLARPTATYATSDDPLDVLESVNAEDLNQNFQLALKDKKDRRGRHRFSGTEAVDWLVKNGAAASRVRAVEVANRMLQSGLFHAFTPNAPFADKNTEMYTFDADDSILLSKQSSAALVRAQGSSSPSLPTSNSTPTLHNTSSSAGLHLNLHKVSSKGFMTGSRSKTSTSESSSSTSPRSTTISTPATTDRALPQGPTLPQPYSVFVLGAERSGKTAIWSALTGKRSGTASQRAHIDRPWNHVQFERMLYPMESDDENKPYASLAIWDFDTHQNTNFAPVPGTINLPYFLHRAYLVNNPRSAAIIVFDLNDLDLIELDYWVSSVTTYNPGAPIIIVGTHSDCVFAKTKSKIKLFITQRYAKVKNVRGYIALSAKSSSDIEKLRTLLLQHSLHALTAIIKREKLKVTLEQNMGEAIEKVAQTLQAARAQGNPFYSLADIRAQLVECGIGEDHVESALGYLAADSVIMRISDQLDQFTCQYGRPECAIKNFAILDYDYFFQLLHSLSVAPSMLKMRGLISLATIMEAFKTVGVPQEFGLDLMVFNYHLIRVAQCMVSLLVNTVVQEKAIEEKRKELQAKIDAAQQNGVVVKNTATRTTAHPVSPSVATSIKPPGGGVPSSDPAADIRAQILCRIPNPDAHCFSIPFAIPRTFDNKAHLSWAKPMPNELVRVYAFERMPGQMLERACIQLVLALLNQLRKPFLKKEEGWTEGSSTHTKKHRKRAHTTKENENCDDGPDCKIHKSIKAVKAVFAGSHRPSSTDKLVTGSPSPSSHKKSKKEGEESPKESNSPARASSGSLKRQKRKESDVQGSPQADTHDTTPSPTQSPSSGSSHKKHKASKEERTSTAPTKRRQSSPVPPKEATQALQDITCEKVEWSHQGIFFTVTGENGFTARLYSVEGPQRETALVVRVTSDSSSGASRGLRLILDNINAFVLWEYTTGLSDIFIPCTCVDCLKARANPKYIPLPVFKNAATFTFDECEKAIGNGFSTLPCSVYGNEVPLDTLVPDLVMSDLDAFHADYDDIIKEKELARSSNGIVYKGRYKNEIVAIKEITVKFSDENSSASEYFADFRHEVWVSSLLKHENVMSLKAWATRNEVDESGERVAQFALVMEFIPHGDLYDWLHDKQAVVTWDMRLRLAEQIAQGMLFLHTMNPPILHHDLKTVNVFIVNKSPEAKVNCRVGDFGEARTTFSYNSRERVDNPIWLAPEVMQKQRYESYADVYAFGIMLWELCTREHPFDEYPEGHSEFRSILEDAICGGLRPSIDPRVKSELPLSATSNSCLPQFADLVKECWQTDRYRRPTFARIISQLQDIRAAMALNEAKVLHEELQSSHPSETLKHPEDLSRVEKEWVEIVESVQRNAAGSATISSLSSSSHIPRDVSPQKTHDKPLADDKTHADDKQQAKNTEISPATSEPSSTVPESQSSADTKSSSTSKTREERKEHEQSSKPAQVVVEKNEQSAQADAPVIVIPQETPQPVIQLESPELNKKDSSSTLAAHKAMLLSTMHGIVNEDRKRSVSASTTLPAHSPRGIESILSGKNSTTLAPISGVSLRKQLAASAMIPVNFLPEASTLAESDDDEEDDEDDDYDTTSEDGSSFSEVSSAAGETESYDETSSVAVDESA